MTKDNKTPIKSENLDNTIKDPHDWTTGNQPMTGAQKSYLETLATAAKEDIPKNLTKAEASIKINELQNKTGTGE